MPKINSGDKLYLCDRKQCGDRCHYLDCRHTTDISHAVNAPTFPGGFEEIGCGPYTYFVERGVHSNVNCNDCVCALVCKEAQDPKYRKQVQSGEIACCDFHPRPDDSLKNAISAVAKLDSTSGVPQSVYVVEECSELIKECSELIKMLMKKHRKKGNDAEIIDEDCDVLTTILVMLHQYGVDEQTIRQNIIAKCSRALERYENSGEL